MLSVHSIAVKDCLAVMISTTTNIFNKSLSPGDFLRSMKAAPVKPLIIFKNQYELNNYRLVSNLTYLSKGIERAVAVHVN